MFSTIRAAALVALALGTGSAALAASHHPHTKHRHPRHVVTRSYSAFDFVPTRAPRYRTAWPSTSAGPTGLPRCWGGSCGPDWRADDGS
jgi:hypothetical protein